MEVSSTIIAKASTAVVSPLAKSFSSGNSQKHKIERYCQMKADTTQKIANEINNFLSSTDVLLEFSVDKNTGEITIRIIRNNPNRIIKEIPGRVIRGGIGTIDQTV
ncbi:MAG: flagellar protein FlaG [Desulfobacterales bacterium]|uniref:Flagellar protein FlaG n=1 Tax=Candidatus Desulfatibia vada TaxID=2841696 RepID=A0A8J6P6H6_9BACT|nr:flagellar protein FlaG [Candidatus Desulfatibia vada]